MQPGKEAGDSERDKNKDGRQGKHLAGVRMGKDGESSVWIRNG